jgi:hypothetical protein
MADHLTAADVEQYQRGDAPPARLLAWDDHLAACTTCQAQLAPAGDLAHWAKGLGKQEEQSHLSYEQTVARVEGRVAASEKFAVEAHLRECETCRQDVADLKRFRAGMKKTSNNWMWLAAAAAAIVLVAAASFVLRGPARSSLKLADNWGTRDSSIVQQALAAGKLSFGALPADLVSKPGTLLGPSAPNLFAPLSPLGALVESDTPELRWQELSGASSYRVEIYDADFHLAASSPELTMTAWTPMQPLERGKLYQWQVTAVRGGESIRVPAPPAPDAKFRVLDSATEQRIADARANGPTGHLLAAVLLAQQGMKAEALSELDRLPPEVRNRPEVRRLYEYQ